MDGEALAQILRLRSDGRQKIEEGAAQAVQLVEEIEDDADAVVVDADVRAQILDQPRPVMRFAGRALRRKARIALPAPQRR